MRTRSRRLDVFARAVALIAVALAAVAVPSAGDAARADSVIQITSGPSGDTTSRSATFSWTTIAGIASTRCSLDGGAEQTCGSPQSYSGIGLGAHRFLVRAYDARNVLRGSDARSWTVVAPAPGPPPGPAPPPPPPSPPPLQAKLAVPANAAPAAATVIDASASTGEGLTFVFDLDGNGSFETKCGSNPKVVAVYAKPGSYAVEAKAVSSAGAESVTKETLTVVGTPSPSPSGSSQLSKNVTLTGICDPGDALAAALKAYECPTTVTVGVAEAVLPPNSPADSCFKRVHRADGHEVFVRATGAVPTAAAGAQIDGVQLWPTSAGKAVALDATSERVYETDAGGAQAAGATAKATIDGVPSCPGCNGWIHLASGAFPLDWDVSKQSVVQAVSFGQSSTDRFLGLAVTVESGPLTLTTDRGARFEVTPKLPFPLDSVGASGSLTVKTDNTDGPVVDAFHIDLGGALGGILGVEAHLAYADDGGQNVWSGAWSIAIPPVTISGNLRYGNGVLQEASLTYQHDPGLGPIWCCVFISKITGSLTPSSISAGVTLSAGPSYGGNAAASVDGSATIDWAPFSLYAKGGLKVVGITLGNASLIVLPYTFAFTGGFNHSWSILSVNVNLAGSLNTNGTWFAIGGGNVCVDFPDPVGSQCAGGAVGVGNAGVAGCVSLWIVEGGAYVHWNGGFGLFWGCSFGKLQSEVSALALRAEAAASATVPVAAGQTAVLLKVNGRGGPPHVHVQGPGGASFDTPTAKGQPFTDQRTWLAVPTPAESATYIALKRPAAGRWTIAALPGSPAIASIQQAHGLPARIATGTVSGSGRTRVLHYRVKPVAGDTVTFVERGANVEHQLGQAAKAAGDLPFTLADGPAGPRSIVALVRADGLVVRTETVAAIKAPGPVVLGAPKLSATRRGRTVLVRWQGVPDARSYRVDLLVSDGRRQSVLLGRAARTLRIARVDVRTSATVGVTAISASLRPGRTAHAKIATLPPASAAHARLASVLRNRSLAITCVAAADGVCAVRVTFRGRVVATGSRRVAYGSAVSVRVRLTAAGRARLRSVRRAQLRAVVDVPGAGRHVLRINLS
jgi:hypothetical protein